MISASPTAVNVAKTLAKTTESIDGFEKHGLRTSTNFPIPFAHFRSWCRQTTCCKHANIESQKTHSMFTNGITGASGPTCANYPTGQVTVGPALTAAAALMSKSSRNGRRPINSAVAKSIWLAASTGRARSASAQKPDRVAPIQIMKSVCRPRMRSTRSCGKSTAGDRSGSRSVGLMPQ